jgi:HEAT repeat protein
MERRYKERVASRAVPGHWPVALLLVVAGLAAMAGGLASAAENRPPSDQVMPLVNPGPTQWDLPAESAEQAAARHAVVAKRRSGTPIVLHRGASYIAPENTLAAYNAGLDLGAGGWEMDIHRTRDNVLVAFHDDTIGRMLDGTGLVEDLYYEELMLYPFRDEPAGISRRLWVPTLAEVLDLARRRGALFILDIKSPGIEDSIAAMLDAADMWDHLIQIVGGHNPLCDKPRYQPLAKGAWLIFDSHEITNAEDADIETVRAVIRKEPRHIVADDPRVVLEGLGRSIGAVSRQPPRARSPVAQPPDREALLRGLFGLSSWFKGRLAAARLVNYHGQTVASDIARRFRPGLPHETRLNIAWALRMAARYYPDSVVEQAREMLRELARDREADVRAEAASALGFCARPEDVPLLVSLALQGGADARRSSPDLAAESERIALTRVRAAAAEALGRLGDKGPAVISALTKLVRKPAAHLVRDIGLSGADAAAAARALARLGAKEAVGALRQLLLSDGSDLLKTNPWIASKGIPNLSWVDFDARQAAANALAVLGGPEEMSLIASNFTAPLPAGKDEKESESAAWRMTWELIPRVEALARRDDTAAREACAQALLSPLGKVRREAFFRLWGAQQPDLTGRAVARAVSRRFDDGKDLTGCAMTLHLLGYLGQRAPEVEAALTRGQASTDPAVRGRAIWAYKRLYEQPS